MSRMLSKMMVAALVVVGASCAISPYDGQVISDGRIAFSGFVDEPNAQIRFSAKDRTTGAWTFIDATTSSAQPQLAAGAICPNSPALYGYTKTLAPMWSIFWTSVTGGYEAKVKARKFGVSEQDIYFTSNPDGPGCIQRNATANCDFVNVAANLCGYTRGEATVKSTSTRPWR